MILLIPVSNFFITKLNGLEFEQRKNKDGRVKLMNEMLGGIKVSSYKMRDISSSSISKHLLNTI